jgi:hypothetical protein
VDGRVAPALVVEAASGLEVIEIGRVGFAAPEVKVADLEVAPEVALARHRGSVSMRAVRTELGWSPTHVVVLLPAVVREEVHRVVLGEVLRVEAEELFRLVPERDDRLGVLVEREREACMARRGSAGRFTSA